ncbi:MAG: tyrosine-type recombinase/integrase [Methylosarcina sp.]
MGRKRTEKNHHALPKYVYIRRGWYIYRPHLGEGKLGKDIKLCPEKSPLSEVWLRYEALAGTGAPRKTLNWLFEQYLASAQHADKADKTRKEYELNAKTLSRTPLKTGSGLFGEVDAERITPGVIRKYIDARTTPAGKPAPVAANREIAFMSICYSWAIERDLLKTNPCKDVRRNSEKPRERYITEQEYQAVFNLAAKLPHIQAAMEFAYLCRMRLCEVLDLKQSDIKENGILIRRRKGSRDNITKWTPRLEAAVIMSRSLPMPGVQPINPYLIRGLGGQKLTEGGFQSSWQRIMIKAAEMGIERFTFHDLKARGVSDTEGDKQKASGHKSASMLAVYDRKIAEVMPAGDK